MTPELPAAFLRAPIAHRALHDVSDGRPENSLAAIRAALNHRYGIEIDVQRSQDNRAMVFHDYELARLTPASGLVRDTPAAALQSVHLSGGTEGIPTLSDVLALVRGKVPLLVEIKDQDGGMGPDVGPLEAAVVRALAGYDGPVAVMSFNPHSVARMAELAPALARGLVTSAYSPAHWDLPKKVCARLRGIPDEDLAGCSFISHQVSDLHRPRIADVKAQGFKVLCWTVKSPEMEAEARRVAHNITFEQYLAPHPS
ncbi:MAG: glycerophosphodiester phosphodiesterase family protein [Pseudomonadota bacterium]